MRHPWRGVAVLGACALAATGCTVSNPLSTSTPSSHQSRGAHHARQVREATPPPSLRMRPAPGTSVRWRARPILVARHGSITSVRMHARGHGAVHGSLQSDARWQADKSELVPGTHYRAVVRVHGDDGNTVTRHVRFTTSQAPRLSISATPGSGWTRGVGETVKIYFNRPVTNRARVERHMRVTTSGGHIEGGWHWFSDSVAHFRPRHFWPAHTRVNVHIDLAGLYVGHGVWGDRNHDWSWQVGDSHISYVNANTHRFRVTANGHQVDNWPTGMGQPGFETRSGTYSVLDKLPTTVMDSCSVGLGCQETDPNYYKLTVHDDVRLTTSGTFVHAAPWDGQVGYANTSHGCVHLSTADAEQFYGMSMPGDVVIVKGTGRAANPDDPGMQDWSIPWSEWQN
ncbi:MAG: Ig-like domain-containing protein [Marmoricola sp.]